ncbi:MAG: DUF1761 domain-containing protein [Propylenella sp.]
MEEVAANVNWLAIIVGAVLSFLLGWLWFSPMLFGKGWAAGVGVELGSASSMPVAAMASQAVAIFLLAWLFGITASNNALLTIILVVLAIAAFILSHGLFAKKSMYAVYTEAGYIIVIGVLMFVVQAVL